MFIRWLSILTARRRDLWGVNWYQNLSMNLFIKCISRVARAMEWLHMKIQRRNRNDDKNHGGIRNKLKTRLKLSGMAEWATLPGKPFYKIMLEYLLFHIYGAVEDRLEIVQWRLFPRHPHHHSSEVYSYSGSSCPPRVWTVPTHWEGTCSSCCSKRVAVAVQTKVRWVDLEMPKIKKSFNGLNIILCKQVSYN